jgi:alginate O-acetyltransferase complex protein AlgI
MLFNSYIFIFVFLPVVLLGFYLIGRGSHHRIAISWLVGASLFFYGWWNPAYLGLILLSILFNYSVGFWLGKSPSKITLALGIIINLGTIGYFKYANFFIDNLNILTQTNIHLEQILLPLAISFFTFQQITYLVDAYRGSIKEYDFLHYCLFVTFFPQLIAGPIVHHQEMLPQFRNKLIYTFQASNLAVGITIFMLGLFKKVVFADHIAIPSTAVFSAAESGTVLTFFEAWGGALAYTFQIYFDFSGYSDMAIGLARMFGIMLPLNFYSPYKANSIIEFWRRWHMTLSRFLRDYVYIPLGGNRKGNTRRLINVFVTMLLGGLWHGAGWTFIIWGGLHGFFLSVNHTWTLILSKYHFTSVTHHSTYKIFARLLTFICIVIAWVMFRSESLDGAINMYTGMFGYNGISLPSSLEFRLGAFGESLKAWGITFNGIDAFGAIQKGLFLLFSLWIIVWFFPNTTDWLRKDNPALNAEFFINKKSTRSTKASWSYNALFALLLAIITFTCLSYMSSPGESEFLYFQF